MDLFKKKNDDTDKSDLEKKIPDKSGLVKNLDCNIKITEIANKIPNVSSLKKQKNYWN